MQIFVHTQSGLTIEDLDISTTTAELAAKVGLSDAAVWLEDADDALDDTVAVGQAVGDNGHVHVNTCRRVAVTVNFAGRQKVQSFTPGTTVSRVRVWATGNDGFDIPNKERPKHEVGVCGSGIIADRNEHIGTLASSCELCLDLAPRDRFQG